MICIVSQSNKLFADIFNINNIRGYKKKYQKKVKEMKSAGI